MRAGDKVKVVGIPPDATDDEELQTRSLFEKCLGKTFEVIEVSTVEGLMQPLAMLFVGSVAGEAPSMHSIWVEEQYLEIEEPR